MVCLLRGTDWVFNPQSVLLPNTPVSAVTDCSAVHTPGPPNFTCAIRNIYAVATAAVCSQLTFLSSVILFPRQLAAAQ
jgi:hypothetical protein